MLHPQNGAEIVLQCLIDHGVDTVFAYPGGATLPIHQALTRVKDRLRTILPRHEQGGGFAAAGYARSSGKVGVCFATSGPGATNLVTCLADAQRHAVPLVAITGQVQRHVLGTDAFQEIPIVSVCRAITKHHYLVTDIADVARAMREALHVATTGRPGPVIVDVPKDIQARKTEPDYDAPLRLLGYKPERWEKPVCPGATRYRAPVAESILEQLARLLRRHGRYDSTFVTTGAGPQQCWVARSFRPNAHRWVHSDSMGAVGFALAAALGVQAAHPRATVVAVDTAESFLSNVQELACAYVEKLPVKVLLFNPPANDGAMLHADFVELARGFRCGGMSVSEEGDLDAALETFLDSTGPFVLDVQLPLMPQVSSNEELTRDILRV
jgi:thiamine pyrophosphate-dependent acetolactate synthase large subunit-like protein